MFGKKRKYILLKTVHGVSLFWNPKTYHYTSTLSIVCLMRSNKATKQLKTATDYAHSWYGGVDKIIIKTF